MKKYLCSLALGLTFFSPSAVEAQKVKTAVEPITVSLEKRAPSTEEKGAFIITNEIQQWNPAQTAIIICDMWDKHWCRGATARVDEMAPKINEVITIGRDKGMLVVHSPSDCMDHYKDHPGRKLAAKYRKSKEGRKLGDGKLDAEQDAVWPIDQDNGGCDDAPACTGVHQRAWTKQPAALKISDTDAITESGTEMAGLFKAKGIKNVILMGVHTNMCVIGRTFGLRNMVRLGMNVVLMRDLTDVMYDSRSAPYVSHFTGTSLMVEYIEKYVTPTMVSTDFTGRKQFRFKEDKRPIVAFVTAEGEYRANQRLPEFAHELLLKEGVNCEFALGKPAMDGPGRHNLENLQILEDADLAVFFIRRVALEPEKMKTIKDYFAAGKPLIGLRTASHSFDAKGNVPREGGGVTSATEKVSGFLAQWPEFDHEIIGGNYQGHYGHLKEPTVVTVVPGMEKHPLLENVAPRFDSENWLYQNRPLASEKAQVLLLATIPNEAPEPVLWLNTTNQNSKVIYTSLGHWNDWKVPDFHNLMINSVRFLLKK